MPALAWWALGGGALFGAGVLTGAKISDAVKWGMVAGVGYWIWKGRH